jgi:hypothetical protein
VNVVLISRDHRLGAILTMALPTPDGLTLLASAAEVPDAPEAAIDAVVLDLPADARRVAYEELRRRYEGRVVVPVDNAGDTSGWPPDAKRRFLVRPFQVADLIAGVQEPQETSVAERAARYRRLFRWNRQQAPAFPDLATPPAAERPPAASAERFDEPFEAAAGAELHNNRVEDQESLAPEVPEDDEAEATELVAAEEWLDDEDLVAEDSETVTAEETLDGEDEAERPGAVEGEEAFEAEAFEAEASDDSEDEAPVVAEHAEDEVEGKAAEALAPPLQVQAGVAMAKAVALQQWLEAEEAKRLRGRRRRVLLSVAAGLVLLLAGVGIGMAIGPNEPQQVNPAAPQPVVQIRDAAPPAACTDAVDDADAVISYLVAKIRDERLSKSIQDYAANARACRRTGRSP